VTSNFREPREDVQKERCNVLGLFRLKKRRVKRKCFNNKIDQRMLQ